jgi:hypothetical protein
MREAQRPHQGAPSGAKVVNGVLLHKTTKMTVRYSHLAPLNADIGRETV